MRIKDKNKEQMIVNAAIDVFAQDGFFKAKMHKIADRAGIAAGTIYLYFKNKDAILLKIFDFAWSELYAKLEEIQSRPSAKFNEKLNRMLEVVSEYFTDNSNLARVFANEENFAFQQYRTFTQYHDKAMQVIEALAVQGMAEGALAPGLNPVFFSVFVFGGLRFLLNRWALDPKVYPLELIRQDIPRLICCGRAADVSDSLVGNEMVANEKKDGI